MRNIKQIIKTGLNQGMQTESKIMKRVQKDEIHND